MSLPAPKIEVDWKEAFLEVVSRHMNQIAQDIPMNSLSDITKALFKSRSEIMGQAALALIQQKFGHYFEQTYCDCPNCRARVKVKDEKVKREVDTTVGNIVLYRPYFYCHRCGTGFYPLDAALGLSPGTTQWDVQELEVWLAAEMPYETASETLERCAGIKRSNGHLHKIANEIAAGLDILDICPKKAEIQAEIDKLAGGKFRRPVLMIGIDGAHGPMRPEPSPRAGKRGKGEWKEVKGFRIYLLGDKRIVHLISWHQVMTDKELSADFEKIKQAGLIPEDQVRICVIGDGAPWIWNRIQEIYPDARKVLDYYHCSEYVHKVAEVQYGKGSQKAREWVEATLTRLFLNQVDQVLSGMKRMKAQSDEAKKQIEKTIGYLEERKDMVDYGALKRGGYHIGSGGIESSNKFISNVRLKRSGAWWYPTNANNMLKLRCAKYNKTFDRIMDERKPKNDELTFLETPGIRLVVDNK
jgi:hypothetical protein